MLAGIEDGSDLGRVLERMSKRDTLVVTRIERLGRPLLHLFEVIEHFDATSAFFHSIQDSIDALAPTGHVHIAGSVGCSPLCWRPGTDLTLYVRAYA